MSWLTIASAQAGLITRGQLVADGVPTTTIDRWLSEGRLTATTSGGVYGVGGAPETSERASWFAVLSTNSVLSYTSAAIWWRMPVDADGLVHITRPGRRRLDWPTGIRVHRVGLRSDDCVRERGLWVTNRSETVLDCMGWLSPGRALILADRAVQQGWLRPAVIERRLATGRWGNKQVRRIAGTLERGADAESERRLHRLLRRARVRGWVPNLSLRTAVGIVRIDVAFPLSRLAIEVDGYSYHSRDEQFQRDRTRQNALTAAGWRVLRFTWADIVDRPEYVLAQISSLLAAEHCMRG